MYNKAVTGNITKDGIIGNIHVPSSNTAAIISKSAPPTGKYVIHGIQFSYNNTPTAGRLTVADDSGTIFDVDVTVSGPGGYSLALVCTGAVTITLAAGGASVQGKLNSQMSLE